MNRTILGVVFGAAALLASTAASAHMDVAVGVEVPGIVYAAPPPEYLAPAPPVAYAPPPPPVEMAYRGDNDWRARQWREHEWREHERHEHEWREHEWHDRGWGY